MIQLHPGPVRRVAWRLAAAVVTMAALLHVAPAGAQGALSAIQSDVDLIARRARPSVVTVLAQREVGGRPQVAGQGALPSRVHTRVGSGVAVEPNTVLTTASVVLGADRYLVRTSSGLQVDAQLVGMDLIFNLALLRVPDVDLPVLRFASGREAQTGDWVIALGTSYQGQPTQSVGTVAYRFPEPRVPLLQLTNVVYPGNSGGAALNAHGELVGIVQGELGSPDQDVRVDDPDRAPGAASFVLPVETVRPVFEGLRREGRIRHGYLGVSTRAISVESDTQEGLKVPLGALVENIIVGSPAERAGLRRGDLIVAFDRSRVEYPEQLARWVAATRPGIAIELVWVRNELRQSGVALLTESPSVTPQWVVNGADADDASPARIAELERRIRQLNEQLHRLKGQSGTAPR